MHKTILFNSNCENMLKIKASFRINQKKSSVRRLRKQSKCPAIIYKNMQYPNLMIEFDNDKLEHPNVITQLYKNNIIELIITDQELSITVKIQNIQYHPFKLKIIHIDFIRI